MDVFNHQDELFRSVSYSKNENDLLTLTSRMTQIQKGAVLYFHVDFGVNYSLTDKEKERNQHAHRENQTLAVFGS